jgi:uncharacterized protein
MLGSAILRVVSFCNRYAWGVIVAGIALAGVSTVYTFTHFAVKTDVNQLFPRDLPWAQRGFSYMKEFPQADILVVVDAPTPELADEASAKLAEALALQPDTIRAVYQLQGGRFFEQAFHAEPQKLITVRVIMLLADDNQPRLGMPLH